MPKKVYTAHFETTDLEIEPFERSPDLSDEIAQTLSRLLGWDYVNEIWRRLRVDATGSIGVVASPSSSAQLECSSVVVAGAADLLIAANSNRRSVRIFNQGADPIVIDDTAGLAVATGFPLPAGGEWFSDTYRGDIFALVSGSSSTVKIIEER